MSNICMDTVLYGLRARMPDFRPTCMVCYDNTHLVISFFSDFYLKKYLYFGSICVG